MDKETLQKAIDLYATGISIQKVANKIGLGKATVFQAFKKNGVKTRDTSEYYDTVDHNYFETLNTDAKAYFAGFLLADGYINDKPKNPIVSMALQKGDRHILESLKYEVKTRNPVRDAGHLYSISFTSAKMAADLNRYSVFPRKTKRKSFLIQNVPEQYHGSFVRGFFDGNGWIYFNEHEKRRWLIGFGDGERFLEQMRDYFCERLGLYHVKVSTHGGSNLMSYSSKADCIKLLHFMYKDATYYLFRKHAKAVKCIKFWEGENAEL